VQAALHANQTRKLPWRWSANFYQQHHVLNPCLLLSFGSVDKQMLKMLVRHITLHLQVQAALHANQTRKLPWRWSAIFINNTLPTSVILPPQVQAALHANQTRKLL
jgi:hypothetical protein